MAIKFLHDLDVLGNIDLNNNQSLNMVVQHLASDPTAVEGKIYYNTTNDVLKVCLGSTWTALSNIVQTTITGNAGTATKIASITNSNIVQLATTQTLANKTLSTATLTGTPISTTPATSDNSTKIATTAYVRAYAAQSLQSGIGSGDLAIDAQHLQVRQ